MKLLMLIHRLPCPPDRGVKLRSCMELRWLARRHAVWCAGFIEHASGESGREARRNAEEFAGLCRGFTGVPLRRPVRALRAGISMLSGGTATEGYFSSPALERRVMDWAGQTDFDAVLASSSSMAPLALAVPAGRRVLDMVDLDSRKWAELAEDARFPMRLVYQKEAIRLERREREWIAQFDATVLVNQREAELLGEKRLRERVHVIETGAGEMPATCETTLPEEPMVGFVGAMDYAPNIDAASWFAESIWPQVRSRRPDAEWWVIGRSPARAVQRLHNGHSVHVTGTVPAVEPYLQRMRVSIAPLRLARGVQTKVLAAMAASRPCVVTPCVAEGIGARAGRELVVADSPGAFADAVLELLSDRTRAEAVGTAGRAFVSERFGSERSLEQLEGLLDGRADTARRMSGDNL